MVLCLIARGNTGDKDVVIQFKSLGTLDLCIDQVLMGEANRGCRYSFQCTKGE